MYNYSMNIKDRKVDKKCEFCDKTFPVNKFQHAKKFCSSNCAMKNYYWTKKNASNDKGALCLSK